MGETGSGRGGRWWHGERQQGGRTVLKVIESQGASKVHNTGVDQTKLARAGSLTHAASNWLSTIPTMPPWPLLVQVIKQYAKA